MEPILGRRYFTCVTHWRQGKTLYLALAGNPYEQKG